MTCIIKRKEEKIRSSGEEKKTSNDIYITSTVVFTLIGSVFCGTTNYNNTELQGVKGIVLLSIGKKEQAEEWRTRDMCDKKKQQTNKQTKQKVKNQANKP